MNLCCSTAAAPRALLFQGGGRGIACSHRKRLAAVSEQPGPGRDSSVHRSSTSSVGPLGLWRLLFAVALLRSVAAQTGQASSAFLYARQCLLQDGVLDLYDRGYSSSTGPRCYARGSCPPGAVEFQQQCVAAPLGDTAVEIAMTVQLGCSTCLFDQGVELSGEVWLNIMRFLRIPVQESKAAIVLLDSSYRDQLPLEHFTLAMRGEQPLVAGAGRYGPQMGAADFFLALRIHTKRLDIDDPVLLALRDRNTDPLEYMAGPAYDDRINMFEFTMQAVPHQRVLDTVAQFKIENYPWNVQPATVDDTAPATTQQQSQSTTSASPSRRRATPPSTATPAPTEPTPTSQPTPAPTVPASLRDCDSICWDFLGDGWCQSQCNTAGCGFDGGDCDAFNGAPTPAFAPAPNVQYSDVYCRCHAAYIGDGKCEPLCNTEGCNYDGGDCVGVDLRTSTTTTTTNPSLRGSVQDDTNATISSILDLQVEGGDDWRVVATDHQYGGQGIDPRWYIDEDPNNRVHNQASYGTIVAIVLGIITVASCLAGCTACHIASKERDRDRRLIKADGAAAAYHKQGNIAQGYAYNNKVSRVHPSHVAKGNSPVSPETSRRTSKPRSKPSIFPLDVNGEPEEEPPLRHPSKPGPSIGRERLSPTAKAFFERYPGFAQEEEDQESGGSYGSSSEPVRRSASEERPSRHRSEPTADGLRRAASESRPRSSMPPPTSNVEGPPTPTKASSKKRRRRSESSAFQSAQSAFAEFMQAARGFSAHAPSSRTRPESPTTRSRQAGPDNLPEPAAEPVGRATSVDSPKSRFDFAASVNEYMKKQRQDRREKSASKRSRSAEPSPSQRPAASAADPTSRQREPSKERSRDAQAQAPPKPKPPPRPPPPPRESESNAPASPAAAANAAAAAKQAAASAAARLRAAAAGSKASEQPSSARPRAASQASTRGGAAPSPTAASAAKPSSSSASSSSARRSTSAPPAASAPASGADAANKGGASGGSSWWPWSSAPPPKEKTPAETAEVLIADMQRHLDKTRIKSLAERKSIFKDMQRQLHPDKNMESEATAEAAKIAFQRLMEQRGMYLGA
eukprot:TRINITY_DN37610_c0_g1_i1.p1 TRINITY_DN37610_c0_g1~~TRINITY_DN37610_c0_g1_i1.p1  ORF type:complete len:1079 (+),score=218.88 TRINITY_DN37610_c0_g1_i1:152-3388(+)